MNLFAFHITIKHYVIGIKHYVIGFEVQYTTGLFLFVFQINFLEFCVTGQIHSKQQNKTNSRSVILCLNYSIRK